MRWSPDTGLIIQTAQEHKTKYIETTNERIHKRKLETTVGNKQHNKLQCKIVAKREPKRKEKV
jgi:hypothetical protein